MTPRWGNGLLGLVLLPACGNDERPASQHGEPTTGPVPMVRAPTPTDDAGTPPEEAPAARVVRVTLRGPTLPARHARSAPPALSGGTLLCLRGAPIALASDPDHDAVWIVNMLTDAAPRVVSLARGDQPGRAVEDAAGRVHVVLRGSGEVATINPQTAELTARRRACPAPRGIAWDERAGTLLVACAGGELVTLPAEGGVAATRQIAPDLRDVVVTASGVFVTQLRSAHLLRVSDGVVEDLSAPPSELPSRARGITRSPSASTVAWRTVSVGGHVMMLHQNSLSGPLGVMTRGSAAYGGADSPDSAALVVVSSTRDGADAASAWRMGATLGSLGLTIDLAAKDDPPDQALLAVASPGSAFAPDGAQVSVWRVDAAASLTSAALEQAYSISEGQATAVAWNSLGEIVVQTRAPGALVMFRYEGPRRVVLYSDEVGDTGHDLFHATTSSGLACASCHPEGGDDGHVWNLPAAGPRRTPSLRGGIRATAPFHWSGDIPNLHSLSDEVFTLRMGGPLATVDEVDALDRWIEAVPSVALSPPTDAAAVTRGEALFRAADVGCSGCHSGALTTNNETVDVGTGSAFQVPTLRGIALRAPYMHDGCAATLRDRFTSPTCGGAQHGNTAQLTSTQLDDLIAFLSTL